MTDISRRDLFAGTALAAAGAAGVSARPRPQPHSHPRPHRGRGPDWEALARRLNGRLLRPGDPGYAAASVPYNKRYAAIRPGGVALCADTADVQTALAWARSL